MEQFIDKLINESDQWVTQNAINDKTVFKSTIQKVFSELPSPSKEILSNNSTIINSIWTKLKQKYAESLNNKHQQFFSEIDINEYLNEQNEGSNKNSALQSNNASLKHYSDPKLNPFFKSYNNISYQSVHDLLDILLKNNQCNNEWMSLVQYRLNQLLSNKSHSKSTPLSNKTVRILSQKFYRLFCHNIALKCINKQHKRHVCLLFNQILLICKDETYCTDLSMNILSFIRVFFEYCKEFASSFEAMQKCIDIKILFTKLFQLIIQRYNPTNKWSNTKQLIFLWTLYERNQNGNIDHKEMHKILKWSESQWSFNELTTIFSDKSIESFADFTNGIYKYNMLSAINDETEFLSDGSDNDNDMEEKEEHINDEYEYEYDVMNIENEAVIIDNINDIKDEDLFIIDMDNKNENNNKRLRDESNESNESNELEPLTKKQRINEP